MVIQKGELLIDGNFTVFYFADTDTAYIFIVVNGADQYLSVCFRITFRCRDIFQNGFKQRSHVFRSIFQIKNCVACFGGCIEERTVKLLIGSLQIHQKFQNFVNDLIRTCFRTVDLVDTDDDMQIQFKSFFQHKFGLRHSSFKGIYQKNYAVNHLQYTFYLASEISVTRGVNDIDFDTFIMNGGVFGKNGDASFAFNIIGVHDTFLYFLVFAENTTLFKKLVYKSGFAVINVGDNGYVTYVFAFDFHKIEILSFSVSYMNKFVVSAGSLMIDILLCLKFLLY